MRSESGIHSAFHSGDSAFLGRCGVRDQQTVSAVDRLASARSAPARQRRARRGGARDASRSSSRSISIRVLLDRRPRRRADRANVLRRAGATAGVAARRMAPISRCSKATFAAEPRALGRADLQAEAVFFNRDYEPSAIARDARVSAACANAAWTFAKSLDHVVFRCRCDSRGLRASRIKSSRRSHAAGANATRRSRAAGRLAARDSRIGCFPRIQIGSTRVVPYPPISASPRSPAWPRAANPQRSVCSHRFSTGGRVDGMRAIATFRRLREPRELSIQLRAGTIGIRTCFAKAYEAAAAFRSRGRADREMDLRIDLARILSDDPARVSVRRARDRSSRRPRHLPWIDDDERIRGLVRRAHGLSDRRCGDAPAQHDGLDAQSVADDRRIVSDQGSADRLAARRTLFRAAPRRCGPRAEQRRLAMGRVDGNRCRALFSRLQSGAAKQEIRSRRSVHPRDDSRTRARPR